MGIRVFRQMTWDLAATYIGAFAVAAPVLAWWLQLRAGQAKDAALERYKIESNERIDAQRVIVARIEGDNATLRLKAADAERAAADAQRKLLELRKAVADRRVTAAQRAQLITLLAPHPDNVAVVSPMTDAEANQYADDLGAALEGAGWTVVRVRNRITNGTGVFVGVVAGSRALSAPAALLAAFQSVNLECSPRTFAAGDATTSPPFQINVNYIVVEHHPPVPESVP